MHSIGQLVQKKACNQYKTSALTRIHPFGDPARPWTGIVPEKAASRTRVESSKVTVLHSKLTCWWHNASTSFINIRYQSMAASPAMSKYLSTQSANSFTADDGRLFTVVCTLHAPHFYVSKFIYLVLFCKLFVSGWVGGWVSGWVSEWVGFNVPINTL